jgi:hypothetical protein
MMACLVRFLITCTFLGSGIATAQSDSAPGLIVTPTTVTLLIDDTASLSAIDSSGRPVQAARWSISAPVAELRTEDGEVLLQGCHPGRAILTATEGNFSAAATVTIVAGARLPAGTLRWSVEPTPGFETLLVQQAAPAAASQVDFYSVEWKRSANAIVRAFRISGEQLWMTRISSTASPDTLKQTMPDIGQLYLNKTRINDLSQMLIGNNRVFIGSTNGPVTGLPIDGRSILLRRCGGSFGDLVLLARGRFRDSLVSISAADGSEVWRFQSEGRLAKDWTINLQGDVGIVETKTNPLSSSFLVLSGTTGGVQLDLWPELYLFRRPESTASRRDNSVTPD